MPRVDYVIEHPTPKHARCRQLEAMFDVPSAQTQRLEWSFDAPIEERDWSIGLIVGPSGAGKSTIARVMFGDALDKIPKWGPSSVIEDFDSSISMADVCSALQSVGFNTVPAWMRPYHVLSTGEKFRVDMARRIAEAHRGGGTIVCDEFTSVVDRQVAKIASHAIQKFVRRSGKQFVAVSCHDDIIEWLQPDWTIDPSTRSFSWRSVQRRPELAIEIAPVGYEAWSIFAPFHYLTAELNKAARCFGLFVNGRIAAFAGILHRPHARASNIKGVSRLVTLPDFQGLGLAFVLVDTLGAAHRAAGNRLRTYPAHPALIKGFNKSVNWRLDKQGGTFGPAHKGRRGFSSGQVLIKTESRPCAVFEYVGPPNPEYRSLVDG